MAAYVIPADLDLQCPIQLLGPPQHSLNMIIAEKEYRLKKGYPLQQ